MEEDNKKEHDDIRRIKCLFKDVTDPVMVTKKKVIALCSDVVSIVDQIISISESDIGWLKAELGRTKEKAKNDSDALSEYYDKKEKELESDLKERKAKIVKEANEQRKNAVHRADRFKKQYEDLLSDIDAVLPGAAYLIKNRAISHQEKQRRLKKLKAQIEAQKIEVENHLGEYSEKYKDYVALEGYGTQRKILLELEKREERLSAKPTYDNFDINQLGEKSTPKEEKNQQT